MIEQEFNYIQWTAENCAKCTKCKIDPEDGTALDDNCETEQRLFEYIDGDMEFPDDAIQKTTSNGKTAYICPQFDKKHHLKEPQHKS